MTNLSEAEVWFSRAITDDAVACFLEDDAATLAKVTSTWRELHNSGQGFSRRLFEPTAQDRGESGAVWERVSAPGSVASLVDSVSAGHQPILSAVSLWLRGYAPTIYVPVPYLWASRGQSEFFKTLVAHGDMRAAPSSASDCEILARELSHSLANVSFSVRTEDRPFLGWIAYAHESATPVYIPDVTRVRSDLVTSAARDTERYLGMASVLYLPVLVRAEQVGSFAEAVLWLWSPAARRWDHLKGSGLPDAEGAYSVAGWDRSKAELSAEFGWLRDHVRKETKAQVFTESQFLSLFQRLWGWLQGGQDLELAVFEEHFAHGVMGLIRNIVQGRSGPLSEPPVSVQQFLLDVLYGGGRVVDSLVDRGTCIRGMRVKCVLPGEIDDGSVFNLTTVKTRIKEIDPAWKLEGIDDTAATSLVLEAIRNVTDRAERMTELAIVFSRRFLTLDFEQAATNKAKDAVVGSPKAFKRYYAIRRGLMVPLAEEGRRGIGLALQAMLGSHLRVYQRFLISPDGTGAVSRVALPISFDTGADR